MKRGIPGSARRPSNWWHLSGWLFLVAAVGSLVAAGLVQRTESRPIGEGEVFVADLAQVEEILAESEQPDLGVRHARNRLGVEAVSLLDPAGTVVASTSQPLVGSPVTNHLLRSGAVERRFTALAGEVETDLWLDGVVMWPAGSILYEVVAPLGEQPHSVLLHYDVRNLLSRRLQPGGIHPLALELLVLGVVLAVFSTMLLIGHARLAQRYRLMARESELYRAYSQELEAANRELDEARRRAEDALTLAEEKIRIRSEFVLMINHELRTPLTGAVTGAQLLRSTDLSEEDRDALLDAMISEGNRLLDIIDQILVVARIENRGLGYRFEELGLDQLCPLLAAAHQNAGFIQGESDPGLRVRTDAKAVSLVIGSLVDNALTHGASNVTVSCGFQPGLVPQVEVGTRPGHAAYITVTDDGPGIDRDFLPRVFEKFEKSSFSPGTGLGLYLARTVVEALQGSLGVATSPAGTVFQIALPAVPAAVGAEAAT